MEAIKVKVTISRDAKSMFVKDITGSITESDTGWGAPNHELNQSCLAFLVTRKANDGDVVLSTDNTNLVYDNAAANTKETAVEFNFKLDSVHYATIFRLPVSTNGTTVLEGATIIESQYFYWNGKVYQKVGTPVEITDLSVMIGDTAVIQTTCKGIYFPLLAIKKQQIWREYTVHRDEREDDANELKESYRQLRDDLEGASYTFYSGLEVKAQDQIESLVDLFQITENV